MTGSSPHRNPTPETPQGDAGTRDLSARLAAAVEAVKAMTPAEREAMYAAQRRSFIIAEARLGSDADEAAWRAALAAGDDETLARLHREAEERAARARAILNAEARHD